MARKSIKKEVTVTDVKYVTTKVKNGVPSFSDHRTTKLVGTYDVVSAKKELPENAVVIDTVSTTNVYEMGIDEFIRKAKIVEEPVENTTPEQESKVTESPTI
jgi:hypothetical protein